MHIYMDVEWYKELNVEVLICFFLSSMKNVLVYKAHKILKYY